MTGPVQQVIVHGGGVAAAMAALAVSRAYSRLGTDVVWVDTGEAPAPHAALIAPPDLATFHRLLGIDEAALLRHAAATINMGQQFAGWSGGDAAFLHAYGDAGSAFASLPFVQHWTRARAAGLRVALEDFCLAAAAAKQGRTGAPREPATRQAVKAGWHLDAAGYAKLLRAACEQADIRIVPGAGAVPHRGGAGLDRIDLADGEQLGADLFIDTDAALIAAVDGGAEARAGFCDRIITASAPAFDPLPLYSRVAAHPAGWLAMIPLANRTAIEFAYDSASLADAGAPAALAAALGRPADTAPPAAFGAAARPRPWIGNVVAVGPAAGAAPPLDGAELLLLQLGIAQLVLLWPIDRAAMPEAAIYNEELAGTRARVADFTAQHFRLNARTGESYWDAARAAPVSAELAAKIDLFAARGMFAHYNHEAHVEDSWALVMAGHGVTPRSFDPQALLVEDQALMAEFQRQLRAVASDVHAMESHADALRRIRG
ncbi:tryptophan 7-halogenase [Sphingopyxis sp.]|uniref:tryptophan 7-halogenase n=1 Tax=Sphingopyxis sp. TaxID=1908224 RepID=UPI002D795A92|nr:tryptophan 7-halogenase [Sphingopyxis sp.]HET6526529.1 tryptophan 7-halogenase [Sphingopyxis sp.]